MLHKSKCCARLGARLALSLLCSCLCCTRIQSQLVIDYGMMPVWIRGYRKAICPYIWYVILRHDELEQTHGHSFCDSHLRITMC